MNYFNLFTFVGKYVYQFSTSISYTSKGERYTMNSFDELTNQTASLSSVAYPRFQFSQQSVIVSQAKLIQPLQRNASVLSNHVCM
jgi:hypothetical protein